MVQPEPRAQAVATSGAWLVVAFWLLVIGTFVFASFEEPNALWARESVVQVDDHSVGTHLNVHGGRDKYRVFSGIIVEGPASGWRVNVVFHGKTDPAAMDALRQAYPRGSRVPVFVDPRFPDRGFLSRAFLWPWEVLMLGLPLALLATCSRISRSFGESRMSGGRLRARQERFDIIQIMRPLDVGRPGRRRHPRANARRPFSPSTRDSPGPGACGAPGLPAEAYVPDAPESRAKARPLRKGGSPPRPPPACAHAP